MILQWAESGCQQAVCSQHWRMIVGENELSC